MEDLEEMHVNGLLEPSKIVSIMVWELEVVEDMAEKEEMDICQIIMDMDQQELEAEEDMVEMVVQVVYGVEVIISIIHVLEVEEDMERVQMEVRMEVEEDIILLQKVLAEQDIRAMRLVEDLVKVELEESA